MEPVLLCAEENKLRIGLNLSRLALGHYFLSLRIDAPGMEYLEKHEDIIAFEYHPPLAMRCGEVLQQAWGYGSLHIESKVLPDPEGQFPL